MPNPLFHSIASWALKKRITQIELFIKYPHETQQEVLFKLLNTAKRTEVGIKYEFDSIKNYKNVCPQTQFLTNNKSQPKRRQKSTKKSTTKNQPKRRQKSSKS